MPTVFDRQSTTNVLKQLVQMTDPDKQLPKNYNYGTKGSGSKQQACHSDMQSHNSSQNSSQVTRKLMSLYGQQALVSAGVPGKSKQSPLGTPQRIHH